VNGTVSGMIARELGQGVEDAGDQRVIECALLR
jgi:hypothetical protein